MTATQISSKIEPDYQVGDRVRVQRKGQFTPGRIASIHRKDNGVDYVVRTDASEGDAGSAVNIWTTSGQSNFLTPAAAGGGPR